MSLETIRSAVRLVIDSHLVKERLCVVWHAGEPLVLPVQYYDEAFAAIQETVVSRCEISHSIQSNGTLIDDLWCQFLMKHRVRIGLSIDGPALIHDAHRKTRNGKGSHALAMRGVQKLKECGIPFHVIAVISADSLDHAGVIYRFFEELGVRELGFNVEELEGVHSTSSLNDKLIAEKIEKFWFQLYETWEASGRSIEVREFVRATRAILFSKVDRPWTEVAQNNDQVLPFRIISVDCLGNLSTFSPELLGTCDPNYANFNFGKVGRDHLMTIRSSPAFQKAAMDIWAGVDACAKSCEFYCVCGGGAPANKYFENHTFLSTETMHCRASIQMPTSAVLSALERRVSNP